MTGGQTGAGSLERALGALRFVGRLVAPQRTADFRRTAKYKPPATRLGRAIV